MGINHAQAAFCFVFMPFRDATHPVASYIAFGPFFNRIIRILPDGCPSTPIPIKDPASRSR